MMNNMEPQEEASHKDQAQIIKGKRTKRQRPLSPLRLSVASSSSSAGGERISDSSGGADPAAASPTASNEFTAVSTEEEEDMANCLILLSRAKTRRSPEPAAVASKGSSDVYQCKTCNKCFPSFQALGGHRASHKKLKPSAEENQRKSLSSLLEDRVEHFNASTSLSLNIASRGLPISEVKSKVHECSICGAEFSSGQALGGHMRRHRTFTASTAGAATSTSEALEPKKAKNVLHLDLNLPAPEDEFSFASKEQVLVFSTSPLVDCHY